MAFSGSLFAGLRWLVLPKCVGFSGSVNVCSIERISPIQYPTILFWVDV